MLKWFCVSQLMVVVCVCCRHLSRFVCAQYNCCWPRYSPIEHSHANRNWQASFFFSIFCCVWMNVSISASSPIRCDEMKSKDRSGVKYICLATHTTFDEDEKKLAECRRYNTAGRTLLVHWWWTELNYLRKTVSKIENDERWMCEQRKGTDVAGNCKRHVGTVDLLLLLLLLLHNIYLGIWLSTDSIVVRPPEPRKVYDWFNRMPCGNTIQYNSKIKKQKSWENWCCLAVGRIRVMPNFVMRKIR